MTEQISPTLRLGIWNKFTQEPCEWNRNLADNRHGQGQEGLPSNYLVVGNLTLQTEGLDLNEDGVELKTIS